MSDVTTFGFPQTAITGGSLPGDQRPSVGALNAWDCLKLALAQPSPRRLAQCKRGWPAQYEITAEGAKWACHALDAVRVCLGLDTLYAGRTSKEKST